MISLYMWNPKMLYSQKQRGVDKYPVIRRIIIGDLMYGIVNVVNNTIFYSWKIAKRADLKCSYHIQNK